MARDEQNLAFGDLEQLTYQNCCVSGRAVRNVLDKLASGAAVNDRFVFCDC
jgi:hypothetical protein